MKTQREGKVKRIGINMKSLCSESRHEAIEILPELGKAIKGGDCTNISIWSHDNNSTLLFINAIVLVSTTTNYPPCVNIIDKDPGTAKSEPRRRVRYVGNLL